MGSGTQDECKPPLERDNTLQFAFTEAQLLDNNTGEFIWYIDDSLFHWLKKMTFLILVVNNFCLADCKFIAFTTHILDENGKMQFTTAGNFEAVCVLCIFNTEADIGIQLFVETFTKVSGCTNLPSRPG